MFLLHSADTGKSGRSEEDNKQREQEPKSASCLYLYCNPEVLLLRKSNSFLIISFPLSMLLLLLNLMLSKGFA